MRDLSPILKRFILCIHNQSNFYIQSLSFIDQDECINPPYSQYEILFQADFSLTIQNIKFVIIGPYLDHVDVLSSIFIFITKLLACFVNAET